MEFGVLVLVVPEQQKCHEGLYALVGPAVLDVLLSVDSQIFLLGLLVKGVEG